MVFCIKAGKSICIATVIMMFFMAVSGGQETPRVDQDDVKTILSDFVEDYARNDELPEEGLTFGIKITGQAGPAWTIEIDRNLQPPVRLKKGEPEVPTFYLVTGYETLRKIHRGELNALTAAGRARMTDPAPLDFEFMEGFQFTPRLMSDVLLPLGFHFFNRGKPEIVRFGEEYSRNVHGGNAVIFYYQQGLRTGWYQVKPGMKINENLDDATNPFPTLFIITKGEGMGMLGNETMELHEGMTLYVPAGMVHQFWSDNSTGMEFVIIMFGEGA